jgi:hypothetical protein
MSELDLKSPTSPSDISVAPTEDWDMRYCILPATEETMVTNYAVISLARAGQETIAYPPLENKDAVQCRAATAKLMRKMLGISTTSADS